MWRGISLANKTLLLFGGAVVLIVLTALTLPWFRMNALVDEGQLEVSRQLVAAWEGGGGWGQRDSETARERDRGPDEGAARVGRSGVGAVWLSVEEARRLAEGSEGQEGEAGGAGEAGDRFLARALRRFERDPSLVDLQSSSWSGFTREYRYAKAVRRGGSDGSAERRSDEGDGREGGAGAGEGAAGAGELAGLIVLDRRAFAAARLMVVNTVYLLSAAMFVLALAVLVFYFVTQKIILSPVRALRETAERVREGDLSIRSRIETGDEFEELSETFNAMLAELARSQDQLRAINRAMDVKLDELAQANVALYEAARLKGEFLASVSHELRTPLNSIIGFAELLLEIAHAELAAGDDSTRLAKRIRYGENIVNAGRDLLAMITDLLEMAKIEAGKVELRVERVVLREACEALAGLIHPLAQRKGLEVTLEVAEDLPVVETDAKKFQQVVFNFLSNAVKFTPGKEGGGRAGKVTLRAERLPGRGGGEGPGAAERVRVSVIDTGPGIAPEDRERIFDKFQQLDGSHTKGQGGTGLGLAICRELAKMLQSEIQVVSEVGRGSMFSLIMPTTLDPEAEAEIKLEAAFRGTLAGRRVWG